MMDVSTSERSSGVQLCFPNAASLDSFLFQFVAANDGTFFVFMFDSSPFEETWTSGNIPLLRDIRIEHRFEIT